ncbi:hypothetical protein CES86_3622 [Brucella lupini]|uniref:Uncharacterized protein n=1 Tax=Brucella lupini TaxID=255457 RepID=A0A256GJ93_9HYPH|nr:hypothetical protein CES86_3622 [Brucella lupini]
MIGYFDLCAVNLNICHRLSKPAAYAASSRSQTFERSSSNRMQLVKPYSAASRRILRL